MAEVFTPVDSIFIDAPGHAEGYKYKVSFGVERWEGARSDRRVNVYKVQMVNPDGKLLGRQAPSYPNVEELDKVIEALQTLKKKYG